MCESIPLKLSPLQHRLFCAEKHEDRERNCQGVSSTSNSQRQIDLTGIKSKSKMSVPILSPFINTRNGGSLPSSKKGTVLWGKRGSSNSKEDESSDSRTHHRPSLGRSIHETIVFNKGPFYIFTIVDGLFYIAGGIAGSRKGSKICLITSTTLGGFILLIGIAHAIDNYRNVPVEPGYIIIPACINFIIGVLMSIHYNMAEERPFWPSGMVMSACFGALAFFIFAFAREFGDRIARGSIENLRSISLPPPTSRDFAHRYRKLRMDIKSKNN